MLWTKIAIINNSNVKMLINQYNAVIIKSNACCIKVCLFLLLALIWCSLQVLHYDYLNSYGLSTLPNKAGHTEGYNLNYLYY